MDVVSAKEKTSALVFTEDAHAIASILTVLQKMGTYKEIERKRVLRSVSAFYGLTYAE
jgi:DNA-binding transcriptional regulator WhiA